MKLSFVTFDYWVKHNLKLYVTEDYFPGMLGLLLLLSHDLLRFNSRLDTTIIYRALRFKYNSAIYTLSANNSAEGDRGWNEVHGNTNSK